MMIQKSLFRVTLVLAGVFSLSFFSCKKNNGTLELPEMAPGALSPRISWALVADPYVACHKDAGYDSPVISSYRKGDIFEIKGNRTVIVDEETKELWYALEDGWIPSSAVKIFSNKLKADNAKTTLK